VIVSSAFDPLGFNNCSPEEGIEVIPTRLRFIISLVRFFPDDIDVTILFDQEVNY
jgi:hypothetical protein